MKPNNFIQPFLDMRKHPLLTLSVVLVQLVLAFLLLFVMLHFQTRMLESSSRIMDYVNAVNQEAIDPDNPVRGFLGNDPLLIGRELRAMWTLLLYELVSVLALVIIGGSIVWTMTHRIVHVCKFKVVMRMFVRGLALYGIALIPLAVIGVLLMRWLGFSSLFAEAQVLGFFAVLGALLIIALYFLYLALVQLDAPSIKQILKKLWKRRNHVRVLAVYALVLVLIAIPLFIIVYFETMLISLLFIFFVLAGFVLLYGRLFMIRILRL